MEKIASCVNWCFENVGLVLSPLPKPVKQIVVATVPLYIVGKIVKKYFLRKSLKGSRIVITGASSGIGAAVALLAIKRGASEVHLLARTAQALHGVANSINSISPNTAFVHPVDCSNWKEVDTVAKTICVKYGRPTIIINCAGAGRWRFLTEMDGDEIRTCMDAPYMAAAFVCRSFLPHLLHQGFGSIINVQSPAGLSAWGGATAYISARWALHGLSEALAADLHNTNIRVHEVILGETSSNYFTANAGSHERIPSVAVMIRPVLTPEMAAGAVLRAYEENLSVSASPMVLSLLLWLQGWIPSIISYVTVKTSASLTQKK